MEKHELWQAVLSRMEPILSRPNFLTWFQGTGVTDLTAGTATVCVPSIFVREWLQQKYHKSLLHAMRELDTEIKDIAYVIGRPENAGPGSFLKDRFLRRKRPSAVSPFMSDDMSMKELSVNPETSLNPRYTFANFIVGSFNELRGRWPRQDAPHSGNR
ncbi:MAG: chromosomal replication initiator protein [Parcubacteria group bacterium Greene0714_36]|nr:MAG: chromosomal replication initiator protein [Parcubacteria group bacterium Greene0714_36]